MRKGDLTRSEAITLVGIEAVNQVEAENCDFTNRVQTDGDRYVEFSASVDCADKDGDAILIAYYYQDESDLVIDDLGLLDWEIAGFEII